MNNFKGEVVASTYELNFTPRQAAHISDLEVQIFWNMSHKDLARLHDQLHLISGVWDVEYDMHNMDQGIALTINTVDDTDEAWEKINKTVETFLSTPLAMEPAEEARS